MCPGEDHAGWPTVDANTSPNGPSVPDLPDPIAAAIGWTGAEVGRADGTVPFDEHCLEVRGDDLGTRLSLAETPAEYAALAVDWVVGLVGAVVADGVTPVAVVDGLTGETDGDTDRHCDRTGPEDARSAVGRGLDRAAGNAGVVRLTCDRLVARTSFTDGSLVALCVGFAHDTATFDGEACPGDALVAFPAGGIHSECLCDAYTTVDDAGCLDSRTRSGTVREALFAPIRSVVDVLPSLRAADVRAGVVPGEGWSALEEMGEVRYRVTDPPGLDPATGVLRACCSSAASFYRRFNAGAGLVVSLPPSNAEALTAATDGMVVGHVESGSGVCVRGTEL